MVTNESKPLRVPALEVRQKKNLLYLFSLPADQLKKLVEPNTRTTDNPEGVQRLLNPSRLKEIATYISRGETCFPNNIIVNFTDDVRYEASVTGGMGELIFPSSEGNYGVIIDGQHRLYGTAHDESKEKSMLLPVTGLMLAETRAAGRIFADINSLQKGISNLLIVTLQRALGDLVDADASAAAVVEVLNRNENSPLRGRIRMYQNEKGTWLDFNQALNAIAPLFEQGETITFLPPEVQLNRLMSYLTAVSKVFPDAWGDNKKYRLTAAAGFEIIMRLFERVHQRARNVMTGESPAEEDFIKALEPIAGTTDWSAENFKQLGYTSSAGRKILLRQLLTELHPEK